MWAMKWLSLLFGSVMLCSCESTYPVSFHVEAGEGQSRKFSVPHNGRLYDKVPFVSQKDFESYYSFPHKDGSYGIVLTAKSSSRNRIEAYTSENLGRFILPIANGNMMSITQLTRPVTTGKLVIWGGFSPADLAELAKAIPPADEKREEPILKMAPHTKKLLLNAQELAEKEEQKKNQKVIKEV